MGIKKIMTALGDLVSPNDPQLVEKTLARLAEQDTWNDVFSTKLIELLDSTDAIKSETRERIRQARLLAESAMQSLERAEAAHKQNLRDTLEAKRSLERSTAQFDHAREKCEEAARELHAAQAELKSSAAKLKRACELAKVAEKRGLSAARLFRTAVRFVTVSSALSWIAVAWLAWFALRATAPLWTACSASIVVMAVAILLMRRVER